MSAERMRCFVAVPIGEDLRADLRAATESWGALTGLRLSAPEGWHVTLAFLGPIAPARVAEVASRLSTLAAHHEPMNRTTGGLGAFPSPARARVAWYGVDDADGRMARLAADVAVTLGLEPPASFRPHVTMARARRQAVDLRAWLASASAPRAGLVVDRIELMRSHTVKGPARYETLATFALGGVPAHV